MARHKGWRDGGHKRKIKWSCVCVRTVQEGEEGGNGQQVTKITIVNKWKCNFDASQKTTGIILTSVKKSIEWHLNNGSGAIFGYKTWI